MTGSESKIETKIFDLELLHLRILQLRRALEAIISVDRGGKSMPTAIAKIALDVDDASS